MTDLYFPMGHPKKETAPQCQAVRIGTYANDTPDTDRQCLNRSMFEIDGHFLCRKHAQIKALEIVLTQETKEPHQ